MSKNSKLKEFNEVGLHMIISYANSECKSKKEFCEKYGYDLQTFESYIAYAHNIYKRKEYSSNDSKRKIFREEYIKPLFENGLLKLEEVNLPYDNPVEYARYIDFKSTLDGEKVNCTKMDYFVYYYIKHELLSKFVTTDNSLNANQKLAIISFSGKLNEHSHRIEDVKGAQWNNFTLRDNDGTYFIDEDVMNKVFEHCEKFNIKINFDVIKCLGKYYCINKEKVRIREDN